MKPVSKTDDWVQPNKESKIAPISTLFSFKHYCDSHRTGQSFLHLFIPFIFTILVIPWSKLRQAHKSLSSVEIEVGEKKKPVEKRISRGEISKEDTEILSGALKSVALRVTL